jgi:glycosyltransferase involved in cell wall biosynthesis
VANDRSSNVEDGPLKVLLMGNYAPDAQESMLRYADLVRSGLLEAGHEVTVLAPRRFFGSARHAPTGIWKWIGYVDKYLLGASVLRRAAARGTFDVVHVCDHSNAVYIPARHRTPCVVTCHDLLAVRGALGEDTDCPASAAGVHLQRAILQGLRRADAIACVSGATRADAQRLLDAFSGIVTVVPLALNGPYGALDRSIVEARLASIRARANLDAYVLLVGSNQHRKNRACALQAVSSIVSRWRGTLVVAGQGLTPELWQLARQLGVSQQIVEVIKPSDDLLHALYSGATALLFPSRFEGFGWPIIEAQACGCPVICSDRAPFPEVAGDAAILCDADDYGGFGNAILRLARDVEYREELRSRGMVNAARFGRRQMILRLLELYQQVLTLRPERSAAAA